MIKVDQVVVVEGRYDKNTLSQVIDGVIIETGGFGIFSDREKLDLLRRMAEKRGLVILTDSDGAGFLIRNYLKGAIDPALVKHAYIPDVPGKERRKAAPSREGKLGVEGMDPETLIRALKNAGVACVESGCEEEVRPISKADLYELGLNGTDGSRKRRLELQRRLGLPERLSPNALLDVLNALMNRDELFSLFHEKP